MWSAVSVLVVESSSPLASKTSPSLKSSLLKVATSPSIKIVAPGAPVMVGLELNHSMVPRLTTFVIVGGGGCWDVGPCVSPPPQEAGDRHSSALEHSSNVLFIAVSPPLLRATTLDLPRRQSFRPRM
jgi:hypothetical protein